MGEKRNRRGREKIETPERRQTKERKGIIMERKSTLEA